MDARIQTIIGSGVYLLLLWTIGTVILGDLLEVMISVNSTEQRSWLIQLIARMIYNPVSLSIPAIVTIYKCVRRRG